MSNNKGTISGMVSFLEPVKGAISGMVGIREGRNQGGKKKEEGG